MSYLNNSGSGGSSGTVTQVNTAGIATGGPITTTGTVTVAGSGNTTTAATATASVASAPANDVVTTDGSGNVKDSGTLLASLAPLASPTFTGIPLAPTAGGGTNTTQIATTAFVQSAISGFGSGTVTTFSAGTLSPLFTTSVATPTTTPALTFSLSNAGGGTVFGNNTTTSGAPTYTASPVLGVPGTSTGSIALASSTASGKYTITAPANAATPTLTLPTGSGTFAVSASGALSLNATTGALTFSGAGAVTWDQIGNAAANLSLSNGANTTTFNQTSNIAWLWANTTIATALTTNASPLLELAANYWTGAASAVDTWTIGASLAAGTNGASTLNITHSGSTGATAVSLPTATNISWNGDIFISRGAAGKVYFGQATGASNATAVANVFAGAVGGSAGATVFQVNGTANGMWLDQSGVTWNVLSLSCNGAQFGCGGAQTTQKATVIPSDHIHTWSSTTTLHGTQDTGISRLAAASIGVGNGTVGDTSGNLSFNKVIKYAGVATTRGGVPSQIATVALTGQTAAIGTTTLYAVPAAGGGLYRISFYAKITTAASVSSVLGGTNGFQLTWTDPTDTTTPTTSIADALGNALNGNTTTTADAGDVVIEAKASTNIQYAYDYTSTGTAMAYKLSITVEYLG